MTEKILIFDTSLRDGEQSPGVALTAEDTIEIARQLGKDRDTVLEMARTQVARAKQYCEDVEFSPMDAARAEWEYVYTMLTQCIDAGATTVNIPDTVGYTVPEEFERFIRSIFENVKNIHKAVVSVHCHNDLGLATA